MTEKPRNAEVQIDGAMDSCNRVATTVEEAVNTYCYYEVIELINMNLGDEKIIQIVKAQERNPHLVSFIVSGDSFGYEGAKALARLIIAHPDLDQFEASNNMITDAGAKVILKAAGQSPTLSGLQLCYNNFTAKVNKFFTEAVKTSTTLSSSTFQNCDICDIEMKHHFKLNVYISLLKYWDRSFNSDIKSNIDFQEAYEKLCVNKIGKLCNEIKDEDLPESADIVGLSAYGILEFNNLYYPHE